MDVPLLDELKRRRVFRALVGYGIAAFAVLQVVEPVMHGMRWPDAVLSYVVVALAAGFPLVVGLAWIFDVNQGRIEKTPGTPLRVSLAVVLIGIGLVAATPGLVWYFVLRAKPAAAPPPSIAVLPFADMSAAKDQEYFSDGIAEEILNSLAQVDGLRVAGRTSSFSFKGKLDDLPAIAEKLHVANVLEGSVRKDGNRIRITAQLIAAPDGFHVWSKVFERELTGVFAVQDEIATAVVDALKLKLLPAKQRVTNPEAHAQFLLGKELLRQHWDRKPVVAAYKKSIELDPTYAPAWARLSIESLVLLLQDVAPEQAAKVWNDVLTGAEKAMSLDPQLPDSYVARGIVRSTHLWDWEGAKSDFQRAVTLAPSAADVRMFYAFFLLDIGEQSAAANEFLKGVASDPLDRMQPRGLGVVYTAQGKYALARTAFEQAKQLIRGDPDYGAFEIAFSYLLEGKIQLAERWFPRSDTAPGRLFGRALVAHAKGDARGKKEASEAWVERYGLVHPSDAASMYGFFGEPDRAFDFLERAFTARDPGLRGTKFDPLLRSLHSDPRWPAFLRKLNLRPD